MLDQTFDRLQKLVSQLDLLDEKLSQEDVNQKLLRSLSPEWNTHVVVWRNKADLDTMSMDDLYNNLKVYEPEVKGMSSLSSSTQNMAFVSSSNTTLAALMIPPPYTGNFMPLTPDLSFTSLDEFVNKPIVKNCKAMSSEEEPKGNPQMDLHDQGVIDSGLLKAHDMRITPTLSFMRPFGCPVTILNTIDDLGKFNGKADEGRGQIASDMIALTRTYEYEPILRSTVNAVAQMRFNGVGGKTSIELPCDSNMACIWKIYGIL
ncbi:hypothetical protein Tco_1066202 [Tanacetum coccineum]|uniref:Uncharacterized protein n=1 Tax=Tanacetum coccineum TaxID=301880 RepID=A0ABQ5H9D9_9ASTR